MEHDQVRTGIAKRADIAMRPVDHEMHIQKHLRIPTHGLHDRNADRDIRHKNAVHHVNVDIVRTAGLNLANVLTKRAEVRRENGRCKFCHGCHSDLWISGKPDTIRISITKLLYTCYGYPASTVGKKSRLDERRRLRYHVLQILQRIGVKHMSIEAGRAYFRQFGMEDRVQEFTVSSATVDLAAKALGVEGARIAKTLSFKTADGCMLILAAGDARIDNHKFKEKFHMKAKMLSADEVLELVGHPVGGVCPFGCKEGIPVYLDVSLQRFETVFPAVGSPSSAIELNLDELYKYSNALEWIDVCKLPAPAEA